MTPHTRIPLNQGICGAAASTGKTVVVDDVQSDPRYLACSLETKSEIVVPVFVRGEVAGELDIDSHFPAAFGAEDRELVEYCAQLVGKRLESEWDHAPRVPRFGKIMKRVVAALIVKDDLILACQRTRHQPDATQVGIPRRQDRRRRTAARCFAPRTGRRTGNRGRDR